MAGHRFEDAGGDRKPVLAPALGLGAMQYVMGEEAETGRGGDLAGEFAGQMQILGDDVERAAGGERAGQHRARDVVEGAAGAGAERHDLRQHTGIDPGLGADQQAFERGDEIGVAEILGDELGDAAGARLADIKDVAGDRLEQRPVAGKDRLVAADHDRHARRPAADRRIEHVDALARQASATRRATAGALVVRSI